MLGFFQKQNDGAKTSRSPPRKRKHADITPPAAKDAAKDAAQDEAAGKRPPPPPPPPATQPAPAKGADAASDSTAAMTSSSSSSSSSSAPSASSASSPSPSTSASSSSAAAAAPVVSSYEDSVWHFSGVPDSCRRPADGTGNPGPPCIVGVDEAGRGCVLGAMVYGAAFWRVEDDEDISARGYDDSKGLTAEVREKLFTAIKEEEKHRIGFTTVSIPAHAISAQMLRAHPYSLNKMSWACCVSMVERIIAEGVNVSRVYVDTVGDPQIYESWLTRQFQGQVDFCVRKKADALFKVVSAASICAKQTRDHDLESHVPAAADAGFLPEGGAGGAAIGKSVGSGYPGDPKAKAFLAKTHDPVFGFSQWVRHSWSTCKLINKDSGVVFDWGEDDEDDAQDAAQTKLGAFFSRKGARACEKRGPYFMRRGLKRAKCEDFA